MPLIIGIHTPIYYPVSDSFQTRFHNFLYLGPLYKWLLKKACCFRVLNSDDEALLKKILGSTKKEIIKISNPIDAGFFKPLKIKSKENKNLFKVLFVGRLNEQKGVDIFCQIVEKLAQRRNFDQFLFYIAGSGDEEVRVVKICEKFKNVNFLGQVSQEKLPLLYSSSDVLVAPSRYETMHWVSLEAQSCGVPVIVTDIPGPREIIIDRESGFLVKLDSKEFINKILFFYRLKKNRSKEFQKYKIQARKNILKKFDYLTICNQLEQLFSEAINK